MTLLPLVKVWLWLSVLATLAGWILSAAGYLNPLGYALFTGLTLVLLFAARKRQRLVADDVRSRRPVVDDVRSRSRPSRKSTPYVMRYKIRWRLRHSLPLGFAILAVLALVGGVLYAPNNHTGLTYRTPRVLQWLTHEGWFWIYTPNYRMNNRACGFEWLSAPLLLFMKSDRLLFLLNFFPFLLLPGLVFSVFTRMGVRPRVSWCWMWLLPTGYCFLLQAGSIANDTFPTVYALAALDFAFRAKVSKQPGDAWLSLLAASLLTGAKASNLPLLLPWLILFFPLLPLLSQRPIASAAILIIAAAISFLPNAIINVIHCGDWSGLNLERPGMNQWDPLESTCRHASLSIL